MNKLALMSRDKQTGANGAPGRPDDTPRYIAFLSYSHTDTADADWLHKAIERFAVPKGLVGRVTSNGAVPRSLSPIFRDRHELAASSDLGQTIRAALKQSRFLIVLCSPAAAQSRWVNEEILAFKKLHGDRRVLAAIVGGEPWASEIKGREAEECFPPALREKYDRRGRATGKRAEPIAADLRDERDGREAGKLKLVAGMLGLGLDDLVRREQQRRQKRLTYIAAASIAGMTVASGLAVFAFDKRDEARDQRREAEGLVGFMLGDLRKQLEPIGRLAALDAVGARALEYFEKQDKAELSDEALAQRSRALTLMGEIANTRGDLDGALARYREAMAGTQELLRRKPDDPQRLFDQAQNVFWTGEIARQRGQSAQAEASFREYKRLADAMVKVDPNKPQWRMEMKYADSLLGVSLFEQRRFREASQRFEHALATIESLMASAPGNSEYRKSQLESLAWLADAQFGEGRIQEAIAKRERQIDILDRLSVRERQDVEYRRKAIPARRALGRWLASTGSAEAGLDQLRTAVEIAQQLIPTEPDNMEWIEMAAAARLDLAAILITMGKKDEAAAIARAACDQADRLIAKDRSVVRWRLLAANCLYQRGRLTLENGASQEAIGLGRRALQLTRSLHSDDPQNDAMLVATAYKQLGDLYVRAGDDQLANAAWRIADSTWPRQFNPNPRQMAIRAELLAAVGKADESQILMSKLRSLGYRRFY